MLLSSPPWLFKHPTHHHHHHSHPSSLRPPTGANESVYTPLGVRLREGVDDGLHRRVEELGVAQDTEAVVQQAFALVEGHVQQHPGRQAAQHASFHCPGAVCPLQQLLQ